MVDKGLQGGLLGEGEGLVTPLRSDPDVAEPPTTLSLGGIVGGKMGGKMGGKIGPKWRPKLRKEKL